MESKIRAGSKDDVNLDDDKEWLFIDIGFSSKNESCGYLHQTGSTDEIPCVKKFGELLKAVQEVVTENIEKPLYLVIEAPLSVAFDNDRNDRNPVGRAIEKDGARTRYWYVGAGASVLLATTYLLRMICDNHPKRDIRLFEGFVSFKDKNLNEEKTVTNSTNESGKSEHEKDVTALRDAVKAGKWRGEDGDNTKLYPELLSETEHFKMKDHHLIESAFKVAGMDFGVPPVIKVPEARETKVAIQFVNK